MIEILFSKAALCYYVLGVFTGYHQKIGKQIVDYEDRANVYTLLFNIATVAGFIFLAYYSYKTKWWAFIGLLILNIITYVVIDILITQTSRNPPDTKGNLAYIGRYIVPVLIILMLYFTYTA